MTVPKARAAAASTVPPVKHVFVIVLENESEATSFGPSSPAPYLAKTLTSEGAFAPNYYGVGHSSLDNYIAMVSGQAPNTQTSADCGVFADFITPSTTTDGQETGTGCVYPSNIQTVADQLGAKGLSWRSYDESMGSDPSRESATCGHPTVGSPDNTEGGETSAPYDEYATRHDPFVYFHSIIDNTSLCASHVVNLSLLPKDLGSAASTPDYAFITPDLCGDGHDGTCKDPSRPGGYAGIEQFLQQWVPQITGSQAFKQQNGLLIVTFDEGEGDDSACCGEIAGPGETLPGGGGPGGGDVGAVLLSPCIKPGTVTQTPYNHYTMLRSVEDMFGLSHLGYAQLPGEVSFGSDVFTQPCAFPTKPTVSAKAKNTKITVKWSTADSGGPGVAQYTVQVRQGSGAWKGLRGFSSTTKRSTTYKGKAKQSYTFRVEFVDKLGKTSPFATSKRLKLKAPKPIKRKKHRGR